MDGIGQAAAAIGVLVLAAALLHWLKKGGGRPAWPRPGNGRKLEPLERLALTPQHSLHLVRVGERTLLVAASPAGCAVIGNADREAAAR